MALGAAWGQPALTSCPCRQRSRSKEGAKKTFQGRVSAQSQLSQNFLGTAPGPSPYTASAFRSALLAPLTQTQCPGVWAPLHNPYGPTRAARLLVDTRMKPVTGRAWYCSIVYLKHNSPHGSPGDTSNPLVSAHHLSKSPLGTQQTIYPCSGVHEAFVTVCVRQNHLIWLVPGSPLGSSVPPTPSLSRLVIHVVSLAPTLHGPVGFNSHMACQMLRV